MATLQKVLSHVIRELQDEELDLVGGLTGSSVTTETWAYCSMPTGAQPPAPTTVWVVDEVKTTVTSD